METVTRWYHYIAATGLWYPEVAVLGEGRVWMGDDARDRGLVDAVGGLSDAIAAAKAAAGIASDEVIQVRELPKAGLFDLGRLLPFLAKARMPEAAGDMGVDYLKFRLKHNGRPLPMLGFTEMDAVVAQMPSFE